MEKGIKAVGLALGILLAAVLIASGVTGRITRTVTSKSKAAYRQRVDSVASVSYSHMTLPTILLV